LDDACIVRDAEGRPTGLLLEKADVMDSLLAADVDETAEYISDALQVRDGSQPDPVTVTVTITEAFVELRPVL